MKCDVKSYSSAMSISSMGLYTVRIVYRAPEKVFDREIGILLNV